MRYLVVAMLGACRFVPGSAAADAAPDDAHEPDGPDDDATVVDAPPPFCPTDPTLRLCFSFDQPTLPATLPNEGAAAVAATLTNVTAIATPGGGAAQLDATSSIVLPEAPEVTGIRSIEIWFRADEMPADTARMGLVDSNTSSNISLFFYRLDPVYQLRCGIADATVIWDTSPLPVGAWIHAACICNVDRLQMYIDGVQIGDTPGNCAAGGTILGDGFTIGSNNNGAGQAVNDFLLGAIDGVRLWDVPITP